MFHYCVIYINNMVSKVITIYGQPYGFQGQTYGSRSTTGPNRPYSTFMSPMGIKTTVPASERPQTHTLDRGATGIGY